MNGGQRRKGFTIVELLVVIVVIGVLAAITIVAYGNVQTRAKDTARKSGLASIAKLLSIYNADNGDFMTTGSGCGGGGGAGIGWVGLSNGVSTQYPKSIMQCLIETGLVSTPIVDPTNTVSCGLNTDCKAYMKYNCTNGSTVILANLDQTAKSTTALDATITQCPGLASTIDNEYGMDYALIVN